MEDHTKMITGGIGGMTLAGVAKLIHETAGVASDVAAIGGAFLVLVGIIKWWRTRKDK